MAIKTLQKTRIAPTPSGYLHIGNALSFALTIALAKKHCTTLLLRIDDLDQQRVRDEYLENIFWTLNWLDIPPDEGPSGVDDFKQNHSQLYRLDLYHGALENLQQQDLIYACKCSRKQIQLATTDGQYPRTCLPLQIPLDTPDTTWRFLTKDEAFSLPETRITFNLYQMMRDFVVRKKDGVPAYQLACVVDDYLDGIDFIVRGEDLRASSHAQMAIREAIYPSAIPPKHIHHALYTANGIKLSKTQKAPGIKQMFDGGFKKTDFFRLASRWAGLTKPVDNMDAFCYEICQSNS